MYTITKKNWPCTSCPCSPTPSTSTYRVKPGDDSDEEEDGLARPSHLVGGSRV